jgi:hypothetical protein
VRGDSAHGGDDAGSNATFESFVAALIFTA